MIRLRRYVALLCAVPLLMFAHTSWGLSEKQILGKFKILNKKIERVDEKFQVNGFFTTGFSQHDGDQPYFDGTDNKANFEAETLLGLQLEFKINRKASLIAQTVSEAQENLNSELEWAFLKYELSPGLALRAGRLRLPAYMLSEYIQVGYAYPWSSPPVEVYSSLPFTAYEGLDLIFYQIWGDYDIRFQPFLGSIRFTSEDSGAFALDAAGNEVAGFDLRIGKGPWNLRLGHFRTQVSFDDQFPPYAAADTAIGASKNFVWTPIYQQLLASEDAVNAVIADQGPAVGGVFASFIPAMFDPVAPITDLNQLQTDLETALTELGPFVVTDPAAAAEATLSTFNSVFQYQMTNQSILQTRREALDSLIPTPNLQTESALAHFSGVGITFDNNDWLIMAEKTKGKFEGPQADQDAWFFSLAFRTGKLTPHITVSEVESTDAEERNFDLVTLDGLNAQVPPGTTPCANEFASSSCFAWSKQGEANQMLSGILTSIAADQRTVTIGVRWDFAIGMAAKMEVSRISEFGNTPGFFVPSQDLNAPSLEESDPDIDLVRITFDALF